LNRKRNTTIRSGNIDGALKRALQGGFRCRVGFSRPQSIGSIAGALKRALQWLLLSSGVVIAQAADDPSAIALGLPLQCQTGETCWVANYLDVTPGPGVTDFRCGARSYDGHDGVDFAIRDRGAMAAGVPVTASAAGTVKNVRDGMDDTGLLAPGAEAGLKGKECGNGVVIDHGGGWQTQYCHMRQGSISVKPGESVPAGATLGAVGMSGWAEFPHVHLAVRHKGEELDPFTGHAVSSACGQAAGAPLWRQELKLAYEPAALYNAGFSPGPPDIKQIRAGEFTDVRITAQSEALVLWVDMFGVAQGDQIRMEIAGPDGGSVVSQDQKIEKTQARRYMFVGKRRTMLIWNPGAYVGRVTLTREQAGSAPWRATIERSLTIP